MTRLSLTTTGVRAGRVCPVSLKNAKFVSSIENAFDYTATTVRVDGVKGTRFVLKKDRPFEEY